MLYYRYLDIIEPTIGVFIRRGKNQTASQSEPRERVVSPTTARYRARDILIQMSISLNTGEIYKYKYLHESISIYPSLSVVVLTASKCCLSPLAANQEGLTCCFHGQ